MPAVGAVRVHPDPGALPRFPPAGEPPRNRFDDPRGQFRVRYAATTRRGALIEVLAGFRPNPATENLLAAVSRVTDDLSLPQAGSVPSGLLGRLRIAYLGPRAADTWFVDVAAVQSQTVLGTLTEVANTLAGSGLGSASHPVQLDAGTIALSGPIGRRITQAVARAVFTETDAGGVRYTSRVDVSEECWAVFDTVTIWVSEPQPLMPGDDDLRSACTALGLVPPAEWA